MYIRILSHLIHLIAAEIVGIISETLIQARCPKPSCRAFVAAFEACAGLQCGRLSHGGAAAQVQVVAGAGCGTHYCAWCFEICSDGDACHEHVRSCAFNPNKGVITSWAEY